MNNQPSCELIDWNQFYALCRKVVTGILESRFHPDLIIAIARGGYIPARVMADFLGVMSLTSIRIEHYRGSRKEPLALIKEPLCHDIHAQRVLIVDDVSDTGDTFRVAIDHIREHTQTEEIRTAALHHKSVSSFVPDYYAEKIIKWRWVTYPWAIIEDLSVFIKQMEPLPETIEDITKRLKQVPPWYSSSKTNNRRSRGKHKKANLVNDEDWPD